MGLCLFQRSGKSSVGLIPRDQEAGNNWLVGSRTAHTHSTSRTVLPRLEKGKSRRFMNIIVLRYEPALNLAIVARQCEGEMYMNYSWYCIWHLIWYFENIPFPHSFSAQVIVAQSLGRVKSTFYDRTLHSLVPSPWVVDLKRVISSGTGRRPIIQLRDLGSGYLVYLHHGKLECTECGVSVFHDLFFFNRDFCRISIPKTCL